MFPDHERITPFDEICLQKFFDSFIVRFIQLIPPETENVDWPFAADRRSLAFSSTAIRYAAMALAVWDVEESTDAGRIRAQYFHACFQNLKIMAETDLKPDSFISLYLLCFTLILCHYNILDILPYFRSMLTLLNLLRNSSNSRTMRWLRHMWRFALEIYFRFITLSLDRRSSRDIVEVGAWLSSVVLDGGPELSSIETSHTENVILRLVCCTELYQIYCSRPSTYRLLGMRSNLSMFLREANSQQIVARVIFDRGIYQFTYSYNCSLVAQLVVRFVSAILDESLQGALGHFYMAATELWEFSQQLRDRRESPDSLNGFVNGKSWIRQFANLAIEAKCALEISALFMAGLIFSRTLPDRMPPC